MTEDELEVFTKAVTQEAVGCLSYGMEKIEHCLSQLGDQQVWWRPNEEMNSIGNLLLHLAGNIGQWIVAGIGDVDDTRDRPSEFSERRAIPKSELMERLQDTVAAATTTLNTVSADQLRTTKTIQGFEVSKVHAMWHCITHFQGHVQEIISLTRQQLGPQYKFQWKPKSPAEGAG